jgi:hypothetical protein
MPSYKFRKTDSVGAADAEEDIQFLESCFVDVGNLDVLRNLQSPQGIIVGRTGSGKTALVKRLVELTKGAAIVIKPESLALTYLSNSNILQFLNGLGIHLEPFYKLLWRHFLAVEILRKKFHIKSEADQAGILIRLRAKVSGEEHRAALNYLETWGRSFWLDRDERITEVITNLESTLRASLKAGGKNLGFSLEDIDKLSESEKKQISDRAQFVISTAQAMQLTAIFELINWVLQDEYNPYYIVIDKLDEGWVEDSIRYQLIRALIDTLRDARAINNAKMIIVLRKDLLDRVYMRTRSPGFQEEKYQSLYLELDWSKDDLKKILNLRVNALIRRQYSGLEISFSDLLPRSVKASKAIDYLLERTFFRPRDIIVFFNYCIKHSANQTTISSENLLAAEVDYSRDRLRSVRDEWEADYPRLINLVHLLDGRASHFDAEWISQSEIEDFCLNFASSYGDATDDLSRAAILAAEGEITYAQFRRMFLAVMYKVGIVGLKLHGWEKAAWSTKRGHSIMSDEIGNDTKISIHPMFFRALGINDAREFSDEDQLFHDAQ